MDDREIRLQILKIAASLHPAEDIIAEAKKMEEFVAGSQVAHLTHLTHLTAFEIAQRLKDPAGITWVDEVS